MFRLTVNHKLRSGHYSFTLEVTAAAAAVAASVPADQ